MTDRGIIYLAVQQQEYLEAALISAITLRQQAPQIPITIVSDLYDLKYLDLNKFGLRGKLVTTSPNLSGLARSRSLKTQINTYSPYQETLFLDADILPVGNIAGIWSYLEQADLAMACDRLPEIWLCDHVAPPEKEFTLDCLPTHTTHFNSGVMLWRRTPETTRLFSLWHQEWQRFQQQDQLALARAICLSQTPINVIPNSYNISPRDAEPLIKQGKTIHLLHCWGGKVTQGHFKKLARRFCPEAVKALETLTIEALTVMGTQ
jgi:hypothetical protein